MFARSTDAAAEFLREKKLDSKFSQWLSKGEKKGWYWPPRQATIMKAAADQATKTSGRVASAAGKA